MPQLTEPTNLQLVASYIGIAKDLALLFAGVTTGVIAIKSFNNWRDETTFKAKFDLARESIEYTYKLRDQLIDIRDPNWLVSNFSGVISVSVLSEEELLEKYSNIIKPIKDSMQHYLSLAIQTESLISKEKANNMKELHSLSETVIESLYRCFCCTVLSKKLKDNLRKAPDDDKKPDLTEKYEHSLFVLEKYRKLHIELDFESDTGGLISNTKGYIDDKPDCDNLEYCVTKVVDSIKPYLTER